MLWRLTAGQNMSQDTGGSEKTVNNSDRIEHPFLDTNRICIFKLHLKVIKTATSHHLATNNWYYANKSFGLLYIVGCLGILHFVLIRFLHP